MNYLLYLEYPYYHQNAAIMEDSVQSQIYFWTIQSNSGMDYWLPKQRKNAKEITYKQ